ncbi:hypothetical protein [Alkaliphilus peptidifermentans]|uniref:Uncharacterized protein n=1 Tax=Alkaliphilus peptidifermentans DSM 18978 TaxID=1120976 RepID=A0A1G5IKU0_9FIRM|nr:hypothetical protein [Alkaliphilus peptidifermentans]SCY76672.1 hypothetical protein SAMN03080606_02436 [Alkaliphilus peptidifermentans DSM 18978]
MKVRIISIKKLIILLMTILLIMAFVPGCGKNADKVEEAVDQVESIEDKEQEENSVSSIEDSEKQISNISGGEMTGSLGSIGVGLSLPDSYPHNILPIIDGANIINVKENSSNNSLGIMFICNKSVDEVYEFYKELMQDARNFSDEKDNNNYILTGTKDKYKIMAIIMETDDSDLKCNVMFNIAFTN